MSPRVIPLLLLWLAFPAAVPQAIAEEDPAPANAVLADELCILKDVPAPGRLTVMSGWLDQKSLRPSAIVFRLNDAGEIEEIVSRRGDKALWKGLLDRFCRSTYAYRMVAAMIERAPQQWNGRTVSEADVFSYLPFFYYEREVMDRKVATGALPAYCRTCSLAWQQRLKDKRVVVVDVHGGKGDKAVEGYMLRFGGGSSAKTRLLQEIDRLQGDSPTRIYPAASP